MWNIEKDPVLRSTIVAMAVFERAPDWNRLRSRIDRATRLIPRFRQRVLSPPLRLGPPRWTVEPTFDLDFHLRRMRLPERGTWRELLDAVEPIAVSAFDRARPLWEFTLVEGVEPGDGGSERAAFVMKVHHSVTDGVGGMELLTHLVDFSEEAAEPEDTPALSEPEPEHLGGLDLVRESLAHTQRRMLGIARRFPATVVAATSNAVRSPIRTATRTADTARSVARILAPATAPMSPLMRERGLIRQLDAFELPLDDVKRAAKTTGGSINDIFVASVIGGLQRYHSRHGAVLDSLRMTLPINLRTHGDAPGGNKFVPARFAIPANIDDPRERVARVGTLVRSWRSEPALQMTGTLAGVLNRLPTSTTTALFGSMLKCCDFVTTNVPGAPIPVWAGGAKVAGMYAFAPTTGASLNVSLISHVDTCCIGIVTDTAAVPDPDALVECLRSGFDELLALG
jgi:diacylglycerol O-acyltransferase / wax synthase